MSSRPLAERSPSGEAARPGRWRSCSEGFGSSSIGARLEAQVPDIARELVRPFAPDGREQLPARAAQARIAAWLRSLRSQARVGRSGLEFVEGRRGLMDLRGSGEPRGGVRKPKSQMPACPLSGVADAASESEPWSAA